MAKAKIIDYHGSPAISIDNKIYPPMTATITSCLTAMGQKGRLVDVDYYKQLGQAGIKIYYVMCNNLSLEKEAVAEFGKEVDDILKAVPDAYIMVRISLIPSKQWIEDNPDEIVTYSDGRKIHTIIRSESFIVDTDGMPSLCSQKWRDEMGQTLWETIEEIQKLPCADRIAGFFLGAGGTGEWYYINPMEYFDNGAYGDVSKAFVEEFQRFLDGKYGKGRVKAKVPDASSRFFVEQVDQKIASPGRILAGQKAPQPPSNGTNYGSFLDIDSYPGTFDFYRAWHEGTSNSIIHFANIVKKKNPDYLVGVFFGSMGACHIVKNSSAGAVLKVLDSGYVDFMANPGVYENRQPGGFTGQRQCPDSFRLRNTMYIVEDDTRTHMENSYFAEMVEMFTMEDTVNVLKRDFGRNICEDLQGWWFDQHIGGGRYKLPEVYQLFEKQQRIARLAYDQNRHKENEIAFIYDEESVHVVSMQSSNDVIQNIRNYEIANIGAPVDSYYHDDLAREDMPDYKLYVFLNCFYLSDSEREVIKRKLAKNNATALFMYANGLMNPDREKIVDVSNVADLTGIQCAVLMEKHSPMFKVIKGAHKIVDNLEKDKIFGSFRKQRKGSAGFVPLGMPRSYLYPVIYPNDPDAVLLGRFVWNKLPAVSVKEMGKYTSVYCGAKYITADFFREVARAAGCHIWEEGGHVFYGNKNFVTIHGAYSGHVTIKFPKECSPYELYEEKYYGCHVSEILFEITKGETKMFWLKGEEANVEN